MFLCSMLNKNATDVVRYACDDQFCFRLHLFSLLFFLDIRGVHRAGQGEVFIPCKFGRQILRFLPPKKRFLSR